MRLAPLRLLSLGSRCRSQPLSILTTYYYTSLSADVMQITPDRDGE